jgi:hypothetical protein
VADKVEKRSMEEAVAAAERELGKIVPRDASLWAVVQACRPSIREMRSEGASWAQIAAAFRAADFSNASESNVRLAFQAPEPLKKVSKARRRREKWKTPLSETAVSAVANTDLNKNRNSEPRSTHVEGPLRLTSPKR